MVNKIPDRSEVMFNFFRERKGFTDLTNNDFTFERVAPLARYNLTAMTNSEGAAAIILE